MTKTFEFFRLRSVGISAVVIKHIYMYIGNVFPIDISQYILYMCSEQLVMNLEIRVLGFTSTKVKLMVFSL